MRGSMHRAALDTRHQAGTLLDRFVPHFDARERHGRTIAAPRHVVWEAVQSVTLAEMPVASLLFALRSLPARALGRAGLPRLANRPVLAQLRESGFVTLPEDAGNELVVGLIAQMWKPRGTTARIEDGDQFLAFRRAGFAKAAMSFRLEDRGGGTRLATETRVAAVDGSARRAFRRYWLVVRPASGLVRLVWLAAIARRATRGQDGRVA